MSMLAADSFLPFPTACDLDEVRGALEHAQRCWQHDDLHEALRSLKRAARGAAERDQVERALELSKAAAELASLLEDESEETPRRSTVVPSARALAKGRVPAPPRLPSLVRPRLASIPPVPATESAGDDAQPLLLARRRPVDPGLTSLFEDDDEEPTTVRPTAVTPTAVTPTAMTPTAMVPDPVGEGGGRFTVHVPAFDEAPTPINLTASRVAVLVNAERGTLEVAPLQSDEPAPRGAAVAMLVAPSAHDAERLALLLRQISRW